MILAFIFILVVLLDILTKFLAITYLSGGHSIKILFDFLQLTYVENRGIAFNLLNNKFILIVIITLIVCSFAFYMLKNNKIKENFISSLSIVLIISGGVGNLLDRIIHGYVVDFISVGNFPVFNIADIAVTMGAFLYILSIILANRNK